MLLVSHLEKPKLAPRALTGAFSGPKATFQVGLTAPSIVAINHPLIFVHLPKTAGTSFRQGFCAVSPEGACLLDYGLQSDQSSPLVRQLAYEKKSIEELVIRLNDLPVRLIAGHFFATRYLDFFDMGMFVTFVRDPLQRVVSEYHHHRTYGRYAGSLRDYYCSHHHADNLQSRRLSGLQPDRMGFIGVTEQYNESIRVFNQKYSMRIPVKTLNVNEDRKRSEYELSERDYAALVRRNRFDIDLVQEAKRLLVQPTDAGTGIHRGAVGGIVDGYLCGWATDTAREYPVEIDVRVAGQTIASELAARYRPDIKDAGIKRSGRCGFRIRLPDNRNLRQARLRVYIAGTNFELRNSPVAYPSK
jgi:hypothetical protein